MKLKKTKSIVPVSNQQELDAIICKPYSETPTSSTTPKNIKLTYSSSSKDIEKVFVFGSFNDWQKVPMIKKSSKWEVELTVPSTIISFEYKFLIEYKNGRSEWQADPKSNGAVTFQWSNSVAIC